MKTIRAVNDDNITSDPYQELATAVILRAVVDYRNFGRRLLETGSRIEKKHIEEQMKSISRFFLSNWYCVLSRHENGGEVLELLDREVFGDD